MRSRGAIAILVVLVALLTGAAIFWWRAIAPPQSSDAVLIDGLYIAMGDSVAAGLGLGDSVASRGCGQTPEAYPNLVAKETGAKLQTIACSGATYAEGIVGSQSVEATAVQPQLERLPRETAPALITLTAGANDVAWTDILRDCYSGECGGTKDTMGTAEKLESVESSVRSTLERIKDTYSQKTPLTVVTGYYAVLPGSDDATCLEATGLDAPERDWWQMQEEALNSSIRQAVRDYDFARFAALDFKGHDSCAAEPWVQGLTAPAPFHPTAAGQAAIARAVTKTIAE